MNPRLSTASRALLIALGSATLTVLWFGWSLNFETPDDLFFRQYIDGGFWGIPPQAEAYLVSLRIGQLLRSLYQLWPGFDWYASLQGLALLTTLASLLPWNSASLKWRLWLVLFSALWLENLLRMQWTQTSFLCVVGTWLGLAQPHLPRSRTILLLGSLAFGFHLRMDAAILATALALGISLILQPRATLCSRIAIGLFVALISSMDVALVQGDAPLRQDGLHQMQLFRNIQDYHQLDEVVQEKLDLSDNDVAMMRHWIYFFFKDEPSYPQILALTQPDALAIGQQAVWRLLSLNWDRGHIAWFARTFITGDAVFLTAFFASLLFCFGSRDKKKVLLRWFLLWAAIILVGDTLASHVKLVPRLWQPMCLLPFIFLLLSQWVHPKEQRHPPIWVLLAFMLGTLFFWDRQPPESSADVARFRRDLEKMKDDHIYFSLAMPWNIGAPFLSVPETRDHKVFYLNLHHRLHPALRHSLKEEGIENLVKALPRDEKLWISCNPVQKELIENFYGEHHDMKVRLVEQWKPESFESFYRVVPMTSEKVETGLSPLE